jgi:hypothetical protein
MKRLLLALGLVVLASPAPAQNAITQEGPALQNSPMMFRGNNRARQGAPVGGAPTGQIVNTGDAVVGGRCDYSAPTDAADGYYKLCVDATTGKIIFGGTKSPAQGLSFEINGTTYSFPGPGNGDVMGPTPNPAVGYLAGWNGGTSLKSMYDATAGGNLIGTFNGSALGDWGPTKLHVGSTGTLNNAVFSLDVNVSPALGFAFPTAFAGYGKVTAPGAGHMVFGVYGVSELYAATGTAVAAEFTARNISGGEPDRNLPPSTALPNLGRTANGVHVTCGVAGTHDCSIGLYISNETGVVSDKIFNTGIYVSPAAYRQYGIFVDNPIGGVQTAAVFKNNGSGYGVQLLQTGPASPNTALMVESTTEGPQGGITHNGHVFFKQYAATGHVASPVLSGCGVGSLLGTNATDTSGYVTTGSGTTICSVNFGTAYLVTPACVITGYNIPDVTITSSSSASFTVAAPALASSTFTYICLPQGG